MKSSSSVCDVTPALSLFRNKPGSLEGKTSQTQRWMCTLPLPSAFTRTGVRCQGGGPQPRTPEGMHTSHRRAGDSWGKAETYLPPLRCRVLGFCLPYFVSRLSYSELLLRGSVTRMYQSICDVSPSSNWCDILLRKETYYWNRGCTV